MDLSNAFDKVWHQGLSFKLESFEIRGKLLNLLKDYLSYRFQRVVLNSQESSWLPIKAGASKGSILGPLLFLIYINDLSDGLNSIAKLFADDTSLFSIVQDLNQWAKNLNLDLSVISRWAYQWKIFFEPDPKILTRSLLEILLLSLQFFFLTLFTKILNKSVIADMRIVVKNFFGATEKPCQSSINCPPCRRST